MRPLAQKALKAIQDQGGWIVTHHLLDATLVDIGKEYKSGLIGWIREHPDRWRQLLALENRINKTAISRDDEITMKDALSDYREFFEEMTKHVC